MGAEDTQFPRLTPVEVLGHYLHLAGCDLRCAIEANGSDAASTVEKICFIEVIEVLALPAAVDFFQRVNLIQQRDGLGMGQQEVLKVAAFGRGRDDGASLVAVTRDQQDRTEVQGGNETLHPGKLYIQAIIGQITGDEEIVGEQRCKLSTRLPQQGPCFG